MQAVRFLQDTPLFTGKKQTVLETFVDNMIMNKYVQGQVIYEKGDVP